MLLMRKVQLHCQLGISREGPLDFGILYIFITSLQDLEPGEREQHYY
jgi:hypothetical protein